MLNNNPPRGERLSRPCASRRERAWRSRSQRRGNPSPVRDRQRLGRAQSRASPWIASSKKKKTRCVSHTRAGRTTVREPACSYPSRPMAPAREAMESAAVPLNASKIVCPTTA